MSIYISPKMRQGIKNVYTITADKHWELETAAHIYGVRIQHDKAGYYLIVSEREKLRGISFESNVPSPKPRKDPRVNIVRSMGDVSHLTPQQVIRYTPGITRGGRMQRSDALKAMQGSTSPTLKPPYYPT